MVVPDHSQTPGEESSALEYFSRVSSPGELRTDAEGGKGDHKGWIGLIDAMAQPNPYLLHFPFKNRKGLQGRGTKTEASAEGQIGGVLSRTGQFPI